MKRQTLKQRRSLAAKKGWETRRERKEAAEYRAHILAKVARNVSLPRPLLESIDRAHREREAQSKHPGSPGHDGSLQPEAGLPHPALLPCPFCGGKASLESLMRWGKDGEDVMLWSIECSDCEGRAHAYGQDEAIANWNRRAPATPEMGAKSEARSELLLTEGMRVKKGFEDLPEVKVLNRIRDLIDRFVKTLRGKA